MKRCPKGNRLFTVGLVSDTHCNEREDFSASPYPANAEVNPRTHDAMACLERERPDFVVHLGDMVHPVPELPTYDSSVAEFKKIAARLSMPLHLVPGNHDIGDKPVSWMPAGIIDRNSIDVYEAAFGKHSDAFRHKNVRFIVLNAALINSGLAQESEQRHWLENEFETAPDIRTFVFIHYPLFVSDPDEPGSYDNLEEPGRSWLVDLVKTYKPGKARSPLTFTISGMTSSVKLKPTYCHRHALCVTTIPKCTGLNRAINTAATTPPSWDLPYSIFEEGHVVHYQRSYGALLKPGDALPETAEPVQRVHTKTSAVGNLAIDMRHGWAEEFDFLDPVRSMSFDASERVTTIPSWRCGKWACAQCGARPGSTRCARAPENGAAGSRRSHLSSLLLWRTGSGPGRPPGTPSTLGAHVRDGHRLGGCRQGLCGHQEIER